MNRQKLYDTGIKMIIWFIFYGTIIYTLVSIEQYIFPAIDSIWILIGAVLLITVVVEPVTKSFIINNELLVSLYLKINPFDDDMLFTIAENIQAQNPQKAVSLCRKGLQINSNDTNKWIKLSDSLIESKHYDDALKVVTSILEVDPSNAVAYNNLGVIFSSNDQLENAEQEYRKAISQDNSYSLAYNNLSQLLIKQNRFQDALKTVQEGLLFNPDNKSLEQRKTEIFNQMDDTEKLSAMRELVEELPNTKLREDYGRLLRSLDRFEEAIEQFELILEEKPNNSKIKNLTAITYADKLDNIDKAISILKEILKDDPTFPIAWANMGFYLSKKDKNDKALLMYDKALKLNPNYNFVIKKKAKLLKKIGKTDEAIKFLKSKIIRNSKNLSLRVELCKLLRDTGNVDETFDCVKDALEVYYNEELDYEDDIIDNVSSLASVLGDIEKYDKAILVYKSILPKTSENTEILNNLGYYMVLNGKAKEGLPHLQKAIEIDPDYKYSRESLGFAYWKLGEYEKALNQYNRALKIDPDYDIAKKRKQELLVEMKSTIDE